ncbi:MAG: kynureninase [Chitinophagaceae bacterium]|nr:kynureninase [Chitinophagaceae bacterium]
MTYSIDHAFAVNADEQDELKHFRSQFRIPQKDGKEQIYFLGNSLGLQPVATAAAINEVLGQWTQWGVEGFFFGSEPWLNYHDLLTGPLSKIAGASPQEVVVMNQLTVNLHLMLVSFYNPSGKRKKIICEARAFPSDQYMLETHVKHHGSDPSETIIQISSRQGEYIIRTEDIIAAIEKNRDELALVLWGGVHYYTGQLFDIKAITDAAHKAGALAGFDLAHAMGNVVLKLHDWNVDFACWCSYKYLNSGPGGIAGAYIHERYHHDKSINRFAGWWGYEQITRFKMEPGFTPAASAEGWQLSTPSIILYAAHKVALDMFDAAGMEKLARKSDRLSNYLIYLLTASGNGKDAYIPKGTTIPGTADSRLRILTPAEEHGCQVSIVLKENGRRVFDKLINHGIFADWREPDVIRVAPVPLYNTFSEVYEFAQVIKKLVQA